jgi:hypothetical protein
VQCREGKACPLCNANRKGRTNTKGHWGYRTPRRPYVPPIWETRMKRPTKDESAMKPAEGDLFRGLRDVWDCLTADTYDDGTKRKRCTILLVADGGTAKVCLVDKGENRTVWAAGASFDEAMLALDEGLKTGTATWRTSDAGPRRTR